jgi:hypothetical protein
MIRTSKRTKKVKNVLPVKAQYKLADPFDLPEYEKHKIGDDSYVKMIDSNEFDEINTGVNRSTKLKKANRDPYDSWYNVFKKDLQLPEKTKLNWLTTHWPNVIEYIDEKSVDDWAANTRRIHIMALSHILLRIDKNKYRELTRDWIVEGNTIAISHAQQSAKGERLMMN